MTKSHRTLTYDKENFFQYENLFLWEPVEGLNIVDFLTKLRCFGKLKNLTGPYIFKVSFKDLKVCSRFNVKGKDWCQFMVTLQNNARILTCISWLVCNKMPTRKNSHFGQDL